MRRKVIWDVKNSHKLCTRYLWSKIRHASFLLFGWFWVFDVMTPEWAGDIARSFLVLSTTTNVGSRAQRNVVNLHLVSELGPEVIRDQLELFRLSEEERYNFFARPSVCCYVSLLICRFISFNLGKQQVNGLLQRLWTVGVRRLVILGL